MAREMHPNSLRNLRPPWRKGECPNPTGINGYTRDRERRTRFDATVAALNETTEEERRGELIESIIREGFEHALRGDSRLCALLWNESFGDPAWEYSRWARWNSKRRYLRAVCAARGEGISASDLAEPWPEEAPPEMPELDDSAERLEEVARVLGEVRAEYEFPD